MKQTGKCTYCGKDDRYPSGPCRPCAVRRRRKEPAISLKKFGLAKKLRVAKKTVPVKKPEFDLTTMFRDVATATDGGRVAHLPVRWGVTREIRFMPKLNLFEVALGDASVGYLPKRYAMAKRARFDTLIEAAYFAENF